MNATQIALRSELLVNSGNSSAVVCAQDALVCLANAWGGEPHPFGHGGENESRLWLANAERWIERGASRAWGFERPAGW